MGRKSFYEICQYKDCSNERSENQRLFHFPHGKDPRFEIWIENSGNGEYLRKLSPYSIRRAGLCDEHFYPEAFFDRFKTRLRPRQNPIPYMPYTVAEVQKESSVEEEEETYKRIKRNTQEIEKIQEVIQEKVSSTIGIDDTETEEDLQILKTRIIRTYPPSAKCKNLIQVDSISDSMHWTKIEPSPVSSENCTVVNNIKKIQEYEGMRFKECQKENVKLKKVVGKLKLQINEQKKVHKKKMSLLKRSKLSIDQILNAHCCEDPMSRAMVTLQLRWKKRCYTEDEMNLAKNFYYYSPSAYRHMREVGLKLPAVSTIPKSNCKVRHKVCHQE